MLADGGVAMIRVPLASSEAWDTYQQYTEHILGVVSDIDFPRNGKQDPEAGITFARAVKAEQPDVPILLMSTNPQNEPVARDLGVSFLLKDSPLLLKDLSQFMGRYFSFGDFVFRTPDGVEVGRANDLKSLEEHLKIAPDIIMSF